MHLENFYKFFKCIYKDLQSLIRQHERLLDINHFNWMARWNWLLGIYLPFLFRFSLIGWPINFSCIKWFNFLETADTKMKFQTHDSILANKCLFISDWFAVSPIENKNILCINKLNHIFINSPGLEMDKICHRSPPSTKYREKPFEIIADGNFIHPL